MNRRSLQVLASVLIGLAIGTGYTLLEGGSPRARLLASMVQDPAGNPPPSAPDEPKAQEDEPAPETIQGRGAVIFQPGGKALIVLSREDLGEFRRVGAKQARLHLPNGNFVDLTNPVQLNTGRSTSILALTFDVPATLEGLAPDPDDKVEVSNGTSGTLIVTVVDGTQEVTVEMPAAEVDYDPCD